MNTIAGVAMVRKVGMEIIEGAQDVLVTDAGAYVRLTLKAAGFGAEMTPEEAEHVAGALVASAKRAKAQPVSRPVPAAS